MLFLILMACLFAACGSEEQAAPMSATPPPLSAASVVFPTSNAITAHVEVVDLAGMPLAGMIPIATATSNAFDAPVATGAPTEANGRGTVLLPAAQRLYVRAWDPSNAYFANNFYDIPPGQGTETELMRITMVRGASLRMVLHTSDNAPVANTNVGLMMFHPAQGPWWPSETDTDADGVAFFPALPAGTYTLKLKALDAGIIDIPGVELSPGGQTDLGKVVLR